MRRAVSVFDDPISRRHVLRGLSLAAGAGTLASLGAARLAAALTPRIQKIRIVREPIVPPAGTVIANEILQVDAEAFDRRRGNAVVLVNQRDVRIRDCQILGSPRFLERWKQPEEPGAPPGMIASMCGIKVQNAHGFSMERCFVSGFPDAGLEAFGADGMFVGDCAFTSCWTGVATTNTRSSTFVRLHDVVVADTWGPPPGHGQGPGKDQPLRSRTRPGAWTGSNGFSLNSLFLSRVESCQAWGELFLGLKLSSCRMVAVTDGAFPAVMVQGYDPASGNAALDPTSGIVFERCSIHKAFGYGQGPREVNAVQLSGPIADVTLRGCDVQAAGENAALGAGAQVVNGAHATFQGCLFGGFNGVRGEDAAAALFVETASSANGDFEVANQFWNQTQRVLLKNGGVLRS